MATPNESESHELTIKTLGWLGIMHGSTSDIVNVSRSVHDISPECSAWMLRNLNRQYGVTTFSIMYLAEVRTAAHTHGCTVRFRSFVSYVTED